MELTELIKKVDSLKAELDKLKPIKPEYQKKLDEKIRLEFSYNSNHIEGNTLTYGETELLLMRGKTRGNHDAREYEEMKGHDLAFTLIKDWAVDRGHPLTENMIKELNQVILKEPFWKEAITPDGQPTRRLIKIGGYKEFPNSVRLQNGEIFEYTSPTDTPIKMDELMEWYRKEEGDKELHPAALAALLHYNFVRIHPFDDGNGRVSRLLMNYVLLKNDLPPVIIKSADKTNYLAALNNADTGDMDSFLGYVINELVWSMELSIKAAKGESIEEPEDLDKKISLLKSELSHPKKNDPKVFFTWQSFMQIYDTWLSEIMRGFIFEVKKFNDFFLTPEHYILIQTGIIDGEGGQPYTEYFSERKEDDIINMMRRKIISNPMAFPDAQIIMKATYSHFKKRTLNNLPDINACIQIFFDDVKYDIFYSYNFLGANKYPPITEDLKRDLEINRNYDGAYFDKNGHIYIGDVQVHEEDGKYIYEGKEVKYISREDILNDTFRSEGLTRFIEPRLLDKPLNEEEVKEICKRLGNNIYEHIDFFTKKHGIR